MYPLLPFSIVLQLCERHYLLGRVDQNHRWNHCGQQPETVLAVPEISGPGHVHRYCTHYMFRNLLKRFLFFR